ncbi:M1 family metallopeptidase [Nocardia terpenica]|uniref:Peptidase n=1 Tax=Nocardia terpenica TaxID=455432 RepID=A0A291RNW7_9NOCA|nr:M1 family metallopeptidase [Nocardia terpenica]ATL69000.1 peptidase [Nocardia terpenica]
MGIQYSEVRRISPLAGRHRRYLLAPAIALALCLAGVPALADPPWGNPTPGSDGLNDPYYPKDGNGGYTINHYDLAVNYDPPTHNLIGKATLSASATQDLSQFDLDYNGPQVSSVTINGQAAQFKHAEEHELVITPPMPIPNQLPFTIVVDYAGAEPDTAGNGWTYSPSGGAFAAGEPHSATTWYPLNDTPLDKATFTVRATVPNGWDVASNGIRTSDLPLDTDHHVVTWEERDPIIGYLSTIAIDKFTRLEQTTSDGTPLESFFAPGAAQNKQALEQNLPKVIDFEEQLYGKYPFTSGGGIYVDTNLQFSLETQTRPTYAPWTDLDTLVHENAHQWWGDSMSVQTWRDVCLNECFASYTADILWPERIDGKDSDKLYLDTLARYEKQHRDIWSIPLYDPGAGKEFTTVYSRGPLFLHALRRTIANDDVFFTAIRDFNENHRNANASIPEFRDFIQSRASQDLTGFFDAWLNGTTKPADQYLYPGSLHNHAAPQELNAQPLPDQADWPYGVGDRKGQR